MKYNNFVFVDVETTGSNAAIDRIMEIGIIRVENNKIVKKLNSLVNPQTYLSPYIELMTGINQSDLQKAPLFEDIKDEVYELLQDTIFVAHNARFDYGFVKHELNRCGISFTTDCCCSVKLSRHLYPDYAHHNLDSLIERFNLNCENRHRAYDDAYAVLQFFEYIRDRFAEKDLEAAFKTIIQRPSLPKHLEESVIKNLPETSGVYIFYDANKVPLYVGKSKNIKERVCAHFNTVFESSREMELSQQVQDIEYIVTAGELGALLLESSMVKELQPYYNKQLKKCEEVTIIKKSYDEDGYIVACVESVQEIPVEDLSQIAGVFKTKEKAKDFMKELVKTHHLCEKLLGLDKTKGPCFSSKIEICFGACNKKEKPAAYNARFELAFEKKSIRAWPFVGPILISEINPLDNALEGHICDNWIYYGSIKGDTYESTFKKNIDLTFNYDIYQILKRYVNGLRKVKVLKREEFEKIVISG